MSFRPTAAFVAIVAACALAAPAFAQGTLFVEGDHVGIGTPTPGQPLHIIATGAPGNTVIQIENDGPTRFRVRNGATGETWNVGHQSPSGTGLVYSDVGDAVSEMLIDVSGNLTIAGTLTQGSSREIKKDFAAVQPALVLEAVRNLPIQTWSYAEDNQSAVHLGPMAEDFYAAFGLGSDDRHIAPSDQAAVALAAIQGLAEQVQQKDLRIQELEGRLAELEESRQREDDLLRRLEMLERLVSR